MPFRENDTQQRKNEFSRKFEFKMCLYSRRAKHLLRKLLYPAMKDENDKWIASAFAFIGSFDSEVSGREADSIPPPEEARLKKLASGQAGLSERHDIIQWLSENPAALHRFAEILRAESLD
jgi:hypothetical protein